MTSFSPVIRFSRTHSRICNLINDRIDWIGIARPGLTRHGCRFYPASYPATIVQVKHKQANVRDLPVHRGQEESADVFTGLVEGFGRLEHIALENGGRR